MRSHPVPSKQVVSLIVASLAFATLSGCALEPVPPCPEIRIDSNTASLTMFKPGDGRDLSDIAYQAEIVSFEGTCKFDDGGVEALMDVDMIVSGGPAVTPGSVEFYYFVAIPRFFPDPVGKTIFSRKHKIPTGGARQERITESNVRIFLPLEDRLTAAGYDIYIGFQLTDEQLRYNRSRTP
ncbi:MAG: hypothetical protein HN793_04385 [Rhodospirillaceae bacterium]|nr:hypothetical protein [Rhodospirillaceae bacterium]MBT5241232.1 hypothetical protein [Rhodospirillaceae bacterium]MBT6088155.1 hypothetical protein [Rhodospirillaceae bacterium]MBT6959837.1 hypothetical protein [Rhodospirillaceae bacterium]MBT7450046.1 hypothetical protein [Rhodospirillaceae bacterium]